MMKYLYSLFIILLFSLGVNASQVEKAEFFFVQIADTQLGMSADNKDLSTEVSNFEKAVEHINRLNPAFVVISGDIVNSAHDPKQIRAFWRVAKQLRPNITLYLVAGNHDLSSGTQADIKSYNKLFGKDYYSFSYGISKFIVLNSPVMCYPTGDIGIRQAQREWFKEELASGMNEHSDHIFVCTHHPWFLCTPDEEDAYWNVPKSDRLDYLDLMERHGVEFAIAGHCHKEALAHAGKLSMIVTGPLSVSFGPHPVGFKIFKVYRDHVDFSFHALDQVPEVIQF